MRKGKEKKMKSDASPIYKRNQIESTKKIIQKVDKAFKKAKKTKEVVDGVIGGFGVTPLQ